MLFGNPTGSYGTKDYQDALIEGLLNEIERVYLNVNQKEWDRHEDPNIKGLEFRPYCWNEESEEASKPNLKFDGSKQEVRWYKYPGRGQSVTEDWEPKEWSKWFDLGLSIIRKHDTN